MTAGVSIRRRGLFGFRSSAFFRISGFGFRILSSAQSYADFRAVGPSVTAEPEARRGFRAGDLGVLPVSAVPPCASIGCGLTAPGPSVVELHRDRGVGGPHFSHPARLAPTPPPHPAMNHRAKLFHPPAGPAPPATGNHNDPASRRLAPARAQTAPTEGITHSREGFVRHQQRPGSRRRSHRSRDALHRSLRGSPRRR